MSDANGILRPDNSESVTNVIADRTVVFCLRIRMIGNSKGIETKNAAKRKKGVRASKSLLDCPELDALTRKASEIRSYMRSHQVPNCDALLLQESAFPVPLDSVEEVDQWLQGRCKEFDRLHKLLITVYDKRKIESYNALCQEELELNGTALNIIELSEFKTLEQVRCDIGIDYRLVSFSTPEKLQDINAGLYRREAAKIKSAAAQAADDTVTALRAMVQKSLDHLIDVMTPDADGKKKVFKGVEKTKEMFSQIQSLNVTNDSDLNKWAKQCRDILSNVDAEVLRDSAATRTMTAKLLSQVKKSVDASIVKAPSRAILFDKDE